MALFDAHERVRVRYQVSRYSGWQGRVGLVTEVHELMLEDPLNPHFGQVRWYEVLMDPIVGTRDLHPEHFPEYILEAE